MITVYGCGFIGGEYVKRYPSAVKLRGDLVPETNEILYFISTVDNYNIFHDSLIDIDTNLITLMKVLDSCRQKFDSNFVFNFISSWFVYGSCKLPAREDSICHPTGFYSITKKAAEDLLISYCNSFGIKYRIVRLCNVVGSSDTKVSKKKNALQYIINKLKNDEEVSLYDRGDFYRDYMHVDDVVTAIHTVCKDSNANEIYNIGRGGKEKFSDIIEYAKKRIGSKSIISSMDTPEFHKKVQTKDIILDVSKLHAMGFKSKYATYEEIIDTLLV